jgi:hypothetical protein
LLTSDALTRALSGDDSLLLSSDESRPTTESREAAIGVEPSAEPAGAADGGAASGAGIVRGAGACAQAHSAATMEMSRIFFTELPQPWNRLRAALIPQRKRRPRCFGRLTAPDCNRH